MSSVLITVPHASGCKLTGHQCDYAALDFSQRVSKYCEKFGIKDVLIYEALTPRSEMDMNRKESRKSKYRKNIISDIKSKKGIVWVVDCHSYPDDSFGSGTDFVILDTRNGNYKDVTYYVKKIINQAKSDGIYIKDMPGSDSWQEETNDIMDTSRELGALSFLIEVKEGLNSETLDKMARCIAKVIAG